MKHSRRAFFKTSGVAGIAPAQPRVAAEASAAAGPGVTAIRNPRLEMARGLTVLNSREGSTLRLGVKTEHGILHVAKAVRSLKLTAPFSTDDLIQNGDQGLMHLVEQVRARPHKGFFLDESSVDFAPAVTSPENILCVE